MNLRLQVIGIALGLLAVGVTGSAFAQAPGPIERSYKVLPGDVLTVSVWKEEDLQGEVLVRPDGAFSFPLCGDISAQNKSVMELQEEIRKRLSRYISDPVVTVSVAEILGNKVYVIGQVTKPGAFVANPSVDVMQALALAGGTTAFADLNGIKILRRTEGRRQALAFDYNQVSKGRNLDQNVVLKSGDVVIVP